MLSPPGEAGITSTPEACSQQAEDSSSPARPLTCGPQGRKGLPSVTQVTASVSWATQSQRLALTLSLRCPWACP